MTLGKSLSLGFTYHTGSFVRIKHRSENHIHHLAQLGRNGKLKMCKINKYSVTSAGPAVVTSKAFLSDKDGLVIVWPNACSTSAIFKGLDFCTHFSIQLFLI